VVGGDPRLPVAELGATGQHVVHPDRSGPSQGQQGAPASDLDVVRMGAEAHHMERVGRETEADHLRGPVVDGRVTVCEPP